MINMIKAYEIIKAIAKVNTELLVIRSYNTRMKVHTVRLIEQHSHPEDSAFSHSR